MRAVCAQASYVNSRVGQRVVLLAGAGLAAVARMPLAFKLQLHLHIF